MSMLKDFLKSESGYADTARTASAGTVAVLVVGIAVILASPVEAETCFQVTVPFDGCPSEGDYVCEPYAEIPCSANQPDRNYFVCHAAGAGGGCQKTFVGCCGGD